MSNFRPPEGDLPSGDTTLLTVTIKWFNRN